MDYDKILKPETQVAGDVLIGLPSSGVHSNGFSLIRKIFDANKENLGKYYAELGCALDEALLESTVIYVKPVLELLEKVSVKAIARITGGGFYENIPRILLKNLTASIDCATFDTPPIFDLIAKAGDIDVREMYNVFNTGVGMVISVSPEYADAAIKSLRTSDADANCIGNLVQGDGSAYLY